MSALLGLVPWYFRLLALTAFAGALWGHGYVKGLHRGEAELETFRLQVQHAADQQAVRTAQAVNQQKDVTAKVTDDYENRISDIRDWYGSHPVASVRPDGAKANAGSGPVPAVPSAAQGTDAGPADPGLAALTERCAETTQQLISLQKWVNDQEIK